jgi:hypothetical protein
MKNARIAIMCFTFVHTITWQKLSAGRFLFVHDLHVNLNCIRNIHRERGRDHQYILGSINIFNFVDKTSYIYYEIISIMNNFATTYDKISSCISHFSFDINLSLDINTTNPN